MLRRVTGSFLLLLGLFMAGWIAYNLLIELQPGAEDKSPLPAMLISGLFIWVGIRWVTGKQAG